MSELLNRIRAEIDERIAELKPALAEAERLEEALRALGTPSAAPGPAATPRPKASAPKARTASKAVRGATRTDGATAPATAPAAASAAAATDAPPAAPAGGPAVSAPAAAAPVASPEPAASTPAEPESASGRAPKGANRMAILEVIGQRPGVSPAEVASVTKIAKPTVDSTISRLKREGVLIPAGFGGVKLAPQADDAGESAFPSPDSSNSSS
jgi:hypothetical protein